MAHILAVDDDHDLCALLKTALERDGHTVETRTSGTQLTDTLCRWADCILLDVMMPGEDGFAVCRRIRAETDAPILFLTARTDEPSVLTGLGLGADDYLTKPFKLGVLLSRVNALLRRANASSAGEPVLESGSITVRLLQGQAYKNGILLELTGAEYKLLCFFMQHPNAVLSKEQILDALWDCDGD